MLSLLGTVFGSILSGGATGLLGVVFQRIADYKNRQLDLQLDKQRGELELAKRDKDAAIMAQEWAARTKVAEVEAEATKDAAESAAFAASFNLEPKRYAEGVTPGRVGGLLLICVDVLRGIVRPGLTLYLCAITTMVYLEARAVLAAVSVTMNVDQALKVHEQVVGTVLYLTVTCVLWWFGTRNKQKPPGD